MTYIISKMYKDVGRFYEGESFHVPDLQYYVRKVYSVDLAPNVLVRIIFFLSICFILFNVM